jgi:hypothetical protein
MTELNTMPRFLHRKSAIVRVMAAKRFTESTSQTTATEQRASNGRICTVCAPIRSLCDQAVTFKRCFTRRHAISWKTGSEHS